MHDNRDVVIHVLVNVSEEDTGNDRNASKGNTSQIHILVAFSIGNLARNHDHLICGIVSSNAGNRLEEWQKTGAGILNGLGDIGDIGDVELCHHRAANVFGGIGDKFVDEDVEIDGVSDAAANDTDRQGEGRHGRNDVVGADDGGHDRRWDDNTTDSEPCQNQETPKFVQVVAGCDCKSATSSGHEDRGNNEELTVVSTEDREQPQHDTGSGQNTETDGNSSDTNSNGVMPVHVEGLCWPEHDDREEIGTRDGSDEQSKAESFGLSLHACWKHGILGKFCFPNGEGNEKEYRTDDQGSNDMGRVPGILIAAPLQASQENNHAGDGQASTDEVDLGDDLFLCETTRVWSGRREVEEQGSEEANGSPKSAEEGAPSPAGVGSNQLCPQNRGAERDDGKNQDCDVFAALTGRCKFSSDGEGGQLADASADTGKGHANW